MILVCLLILNCRVRSTRSHAASISVPAARSSASSSTSGEGRRYTGQLKCDDNDDDDDDDNNNKRHAGADRNQTISDQTTTHAAKTTDARR